MSSAPLIENYPGYNKILGSELANNMYEQVLDLGVDIELEEVKEIKIDSKKYVITEENTYETDAIILATGSKYRLLGLEKEEELIGKGVHFCVACDGAFYKDKDVAVIGGGNSAVINALTLSDICKKVYLIQNLDKLTAEDALTEKLSDKSNVEVMLSSTVDKILGEDELTGIIINQKDNKETINLDGVFVSIGLIPQNELAKNILPLNEYGYLIADNSKTEIPGVFVAGDCRDKMVRQITVAVSDGTVAALHAVEYLNDLK